MIKRYGVPLLFCQNLLDLEEYPSAALGDVDMGPFRGCRYTLKLQRAVSIILRLFGGTVQLKTDWHVIIFRLKWMVKLHDHILKRYNRIPTRLKLTNDVHASRLIFARTTHDSTKKWYFRCKGVH